MKTLNIVHLYPNELNLYGDTGNVVCLSHRAKKRGFGVKIIPLGIGDRLCDFDLLFIGGGQDREMEIISSDLRKKSDALAYCISQHKVVLAICGGYQILGEYYLSQSGEKMNLSSVLPFYTVSGNKRMIGNIVFDTTAGKVVGFENHSGKTYLSETLQPLGRVISGCGNNGEDGSEGLIYNNTYCTYAHGPVLPKNPTFADKLLSLAIGTELLEPIDDDIENICHNSLIKRFG